MQEGEGTIELSFHGVDGITVVTELKLINHLLRHPELILLPVLARLLRIARSNCYRKPIGGYSVSFTPRFDSFVDFVLKKFCKSNSQLSIDTMHGRSQS